MTKPILLRYNYGVTDAEMQLQRMEEELKTDGATSSSIDSDLSSSPFLSKSQALAYLQNGSSSRRSKRSAAASARTRARKRHGYQGIICECCHNMCTFYELTQYCAEESASDAIMIRSTSLLAKRSVANSNEELETQQKQSHLLKLLVDLSSPVKHSQNVHQRDAIDTRTNNPDTEAEPDTQPTLLHHPVDKKSTFRDPIDDVIS